MLLVCNDGYALYAAVAITSIRENKLPEEKVVIHILENRVSQIHKQMILGLGNNNDFKIMFYNIEDDLKELMRSGVCPLRGSYMTYGRLLFYKHLPRKITKLLYLDCDTIACRSLKDIFLFDMQENVIAGIQDIVAVEYLNAIGFPKGEKYICAGVMLINVQRWDLDYLLNGLKKLASNGKEYTYGDQDYLNLIFKGRIGVLPFNFGELNIANWNYEQFLNYRGRERSYPFYTQQELEKRDSPVIIHLVEQPWIRWSLCKERNIWLHYLKISGFETQFHYASFLQNPKKNIFKILLRILPEKIRFALLCWRYHEINRKIFIPNLH